MRIVCKYHTRKIVRNNTSRKRYSYTSIESNMHSRLNNKLKDAIYRYIYINTMQHYLCSLSLSLFCMQFYINPNPRTIIALDFYALTSHKFEIKIFTSYVAKLMRDPSGENVACFNFFKKLNNLPQKACLSV